MYKSRLDYKKTALKSRLVTAVRYIGVRARSIKMLNTAAQDQKQCFTCKTSFYGNTSAAIRVNYIESLIFAID